MHKLYGLTFRRVAELKRRNWLEVASRRRRLVADVDRLFSRIERERRFEDGRRNRDDAAADVRAA